MVKPIHLTATEAQRLNLDNHDVSVEHHMRCGKCGGNVIRDGESVTCLQCGKEYLSFAQRHQLYETNKPDIILDYKERGWGFTQHKYQMRSGTLLGLLKRWGVELNSPQHNQKSRKRRKQAPQPTDSGTDQVAGSSSAESKNVTERTAPVSPIFPMTIATEDLAGLNPEEFDHVWQSLGMVTFRRLKRRG